MTSNVHLREQSKTSDHLTEIVNRKPVGGWIWNIACLFSGALLGLAAPGIGLWYLAWIGLTPLFLFIYSSNRPRQAICRGFLFGLGYHLVYLVWYTAISMGSGDNQLLRTAISYLAETTHQSIIFAAFAAIAFLLPFRGSFRSSAGESSWHFPALLFLPLLWVLFINKIANSYALCGIPWAMLSYTQYRQLDIIQVASVIGGVGLEYLIVLANTAIAIVAATTLAVLNCKQLAADSVRSSYLQLLGTVVALLGVVVAGSIYVDSREVSPDVHVSCMQTHCFDHISESFKQQVQLYSKCKPGLCMWPFIPVPLRSNPQYLERLSVAAKSKNIDIIVPTNTLSGIAGEHFKSVLAIKRDGTIGNRTYHKRILVPVREFEPAIFRFFPPLISDRFRPLMTPTSGGVSPTVLPVEKGNVAPLVCFEVISPEAASSSVRNGGHLLTNISNRSWLHGPAGKILGEQQIAMAAMRAVENRRYFVALSNNGPSAIIEPTGKIVAQAPFDKMMLLEGRVEFLTDESIFNRINSALGF